MPRYAIRIGDRYMEWSTVVDAPISDGMEWDELVAYYRRHYGEAGVERLLARQERLRDYGHTLGDTSITVEDLIADNRAGPDETSISADEIYRMCCRREMRQSHE